MERELLAMLRLCGGECSEAEVYECFAALGFPDEEITETLESLVEQCKIHETCDQAWRLGRAPDDDDRSDR